VANSLAVVIPQLLAQALGPLRANSIMPRLVNRAYEAQAREQGDTIDIPFSSAMTATDVVPSNTQPTTPDSAPSKIQMQLSQWKESAFYMTDLDIKRVMDGYLPKQAMEAVKVLCNTVDSYILSFYKGIYGFTGTPGTAPFSQAPANLDMSDATNVLTVLTQQLCPGDERAIVLDPIAQGKAMNQRALQDQSWRGDNSVIKTGQIGSAFGMDWYMDQNIPIHTSTPLSAGAATVNGVQTVAQGSTDSGRTGTVSIAKATNPSNLVRGDVLTFAGDTQTYVVLADVTLAVGNTTVSISPALKVAKAGGEAVSLKASHTVNLAFSRDAIAFASAPLDDVHAEELGSMVQSTVDPISGLTLRLEVKRENKRNRWAFDILYGAQLVRPEYACRIAG
jgi:hypothetical protein